MANESELIIEAGLGSRHYWRDLWSHRELLYFLAWRDILVRYKQMVIGVAWSVLRPFLTMVVFTVVFGRLAQFPSEGVPYPVLVFAAMLPWQLFANALSESSGSLVNNASMLSKVYFPRLIIPLSTLAVCLIDSLISFGLLTFIMVWFQFVPSWRIVFLPFMLLLALTVAFGAGIWFAALNVRYRDVRYIVPFLVQSGLFISPVGFSSSIVPDRWRLIYSMNPLVGVIDGFRWAVMGDGSLLYLPGFFLSIVLTVGFCWTGIWYFRRTERTFADVI